MIWPLPEGFRNKPAPTAPGGEPTPQPRQVDMGLERTLLALASYGKPFVMLGSSGWHCSVDMHVNATGAKFEVKSSHDKASPTEAANECFARMRDILQGFVATVKKLDNSSLAELGVQE